MTVNESENPYAVGPDGPIYLTAAEVAQRFRVAQSSLSEWRQRGDGPLAVRFGARVLYPLPEVQRWEAEQLEKARQEQRRRAGHGYR